MKILYHIKTYLKSYFIQYIKIIIFSPIFFINRKHYRGIIPTHLRHIYFKLIQLRYFKDLNRFKIEKKKNLIHENFISENLSTNGFCFSNFEEFEDHNYVFEFLKNEFGEQFNESYVENKQRHMVTHDIGKHFIKNERLNSFIFQPKIYESISNYMDAKPILARVFFMYSYKENYLDANSPQYFHSDYEDLKGVKLFVNLENINNENGPFTFIDKKISNKIYIDTLYSKNPKINSDKKRLDDKLVESYVSPSEWKNNQGCEKSTLFIDTNECLHYGSRLKKGKRKMVCFFFVSPFSFYFKDDFLNYLNTNSTENQKEILFSHLKFINL